ncbi:MAG TPA: YIP1 family protein [Candidatus Polarisedimenticolaceae bacterium]|nr:YIP1 family protein [Candidatus Polarisedimenticolaceae bacterium]
MTDFPPYEPPPPPPPAPPAPPEALPWEAPNAGLGSIFPTAGEFLAHPVLAYRKMSKTADLVRPIAFFVAFVLLGTILGQIWQLLLWNQVMELIHRFNFIPEQFQSLIHRPGAIQIAVGLVVAPLIYLVVLFIWSAAIHVGLAALGGAPEGFATTLRVICYARTADVGLAIPLLGGLVTFVWRRVLEVVGLAQAHRTDAWKALLAVIFPMVFCCLCMVAGVFAFGAAIGQALQQMK